MSCYLTKTCHRHLLLVRGMKELVADTRGVVFVVDDDPSICDLLSDLVQSVGLQAQSFQSAHGFLELQLPDAPCCLVLDVRLPGLSGLDLQAKLTSIGISVPIIFMSAYGDVPLTVRAMKGGAVDFLLKPYHGQDMLDAIQYGLALDHRRREAQAGLSTLLSRYSALSPRERNIMALVTQGLMNKQIACTLGVSEITVKVNRAKVMKKMAAVSLADLVRMARDLNVESRAE